MAQLKVVINLNDKNNTTIEVDNKYLDGVSSLVQTTSDATTPAYNILANTGSVDIVDENQKIRKILESVDFEPDNVSVDIFINNNKLQAHISEDADYTISDNILSFSLSNKVKNYKNKPYSIYYSYKKTLAQLLNSLLIDVGVSQEQIDKAFSKKLISPNANIYDTTYNILNSITFPEIYYSNSNYETAISDACTVAQIALVFDDNDELSVHSLRPSIMTPDISSAIRITQDTIFEGLDYSVIKKNKLTQISIPNNYFTIEYKNLEIESEVVKFTTTKNSSNGTQVINYPSIDGYEFYTVGKEDAINRGNGFFYIVTKFKKPYDIGNASSINTGTKEPYYRFTLNPETDNSQSSGEIYYEFEDESEFNDELWSRISDHSAESDDYFIIGIKSPSFLRSGSYYYTAILCQYAIGIEYFLGIEGLDSLSFNVVYGSPSEYIYFNRGSNVFYGSSGHILELPDNNLFLEEGKNLGYSSTELFAKTVLSDYNKGVTLGKITVCCSNFYYKDGGVAVNWSNGELLQVGQYVFITNDKLSDGSQRYWRIIGRNFKYEGVPMLDLELLQVAVVPLADGLYDADYNIISLYQKLVDDGNLVVSENSISDFSEDKTGRLVLVNSSFDTVSGFDYSSLSYIELPNTVSTLGVGCFMYSDIVEITIPEGVTTLSEWSFNGCKALTKINLPNSLTTIGNASIAYCSSLEELVIPENVNYVWGVAFQGNTSMKIYDFSNVKVVPSSNDTGEYMFQGIPDDCKIVVPDDLYNDFINDKIWSVWSNYIVPKSYIDAGLFNQSTGARIYSWDSLINDGKITVDGSVITKVDSSLTGRLVIPTNINEIADSSFNMSSLTSISMPAVETVGQYAFWGAYKLEFEDLSNVKTISYRSFYNCNKLVYINIPSCKTIGDLAFEASYYIKAIKFRDIEQIGGNIFGGSTTGGKATIDYLDFSGCSSIPSRSGGWGSLGSDNFKIIVPDHLYDSWIVADGWSYDAELGRIVKASEV